MYVKYVPPFELKTSEKCAWRVVYFYLRRKDRYGEDQLVQVARIGIDSRMGHYLDKSGIRLVGSFFGFSFDLPLLKMRYRHGRGKLFYKVYGIYNMLRHKADGRYGR